MNQQQNFYSIGWNDSISLKCVTTGYYVYFINRNQQNIKIFCEKNTMILKNEKTEDSEGNDLINDYMNIVRYEELDMSDKGERWEGGVLNSKPFGFGCYFDENNNLIYRGFVYEGKKICFGEDFYSDSNTIEYCGNFINGLRHGWGCLYDKESNLIYEGYWAFGMNNDFSLKITENFEDDGMIHNLVKDLRIDDNCFSNFVELKIMYYGNLNSIDIGNNCFKEVREFEISDCNGLTVINIGMDSFCKNKNNIQDKDGKLNIHDCLRLSYISIKCASFSDYTECFKLYSMITFFVVIRSTYVK